jgi:hypothetical protein
VLVDKQPAGRPCATIAMLPLQVRLSRPRLAHASRSWLHAGSSSYMHGCDLQRCFVSHGELTPPTPWCTVSGRRANDDFCDARTHVPKSGGREPAVGLVTQLQLRTLSSSDWRQPARYVSSAIGIADAFVRGPALAPRWSETTFATATRWISTFRVRIPRTSHGGLTPLAPGAERRFPGEKTIVAMQKRT